MKCNRNKCPLLGRGPDVKFECWESEGIVTSGELLPSSDSEPQLYHTEYYAGQACSPVT